eukprot:TRINITY_DN4917_c0_g1_i2.p2 TRINITY_DN4917_c0_g1~~TRINITY_DN4917_c0_g1_i2.p2  ORF type:complete len:171 (+),score=66.59 TRINITY_DN4917_c0_g1_i2:450-962(+)
MSTNYYQSPEKGHQPRQNQQQGEQRNVIQVRQYRGLEEEEENAQSEEQEEEDEEERLQNKVTVYHHKGEPLRNIAVPIAKDQQGTVRIEPKEEMIDEPPPTNEVEDEQLTKKATKAISKYAEIHAMKQVAPAGKGKKEKEANEGQGDEEATTEGKIRINNNIDLHRLLFD